LSQSEDQESNLFVIDPARHTKTRLTFDKGVNSAPAWSPDGHRVIYQWAAGPVATTDDFVLLSRSVDGSDTPDTLLRGGVLPSVSPDGRYLIYSADPGHTWEFDLMVRPLEPGGVPIAIAKGAGDQFAGVVSPRGDLLAYSSDESGTFQVYIKRFPSGEGRWQVSTNSGAWPRWNGKGDRLYYVDQNDLMEVEIGGGVVPVLGSPQRLFTRGQTGNGFRSLVASFDVAPNGRLVLLKPIGLGVGTTSVAAIQNWYEGFGNKKS
jgi:Tol biopolymer transport system component